MAEQVLIDVKALLNEVTEANIAGFYEANEHSRETYYEIKQIIKNAPVIEERKTGKWIADKYGNVLCSECNWCAPKIMMGCNSNRHLAYTKSDYCWHCGARMVQEGEDNG